jgi:predicted nucleic acid-binding protein
VSAFFDTNVLVYAQQVDGKADRARALFATGGKLSVQVLNEFAAVSRRKQKRDGAKSPKRSPTCSRWSIRRCR